MHFPGAIKFVLIAISSFPTEAELLPLFILVPLDFPFCDYLFSFFTGLKGKTRSRSPRECRLPFSLSGSRSYIFHPRL